MRKLFCEVDCLQFPPGTKLSLLGKPSLLVRVVAIPSSSFGVSGSSKRNGDGPVVWGQQNGNKFFVQLSNQDSSLRVEIWKTSVVFKDECIDATRVDLGAIPNGTAIPVDLDFPKKSSLRLTLELTSATSSQEVPRHSSSSTFNSSGEGRKLGSGDGQVTNAASGREAMLRAAELRQQDWRTGWAGTSEQQKAIQVRRQKDALLGKIEAKYKSKGSEAPIGLGSASVEQLQRHLEAL